jgi:hypothetical protein
MTDMNQTHLPDTDKYMIISFNELEMVLTLLTAPGKTHLIVDTLSTVRTLNGTEGPERALMTLVSGIAWLTEEPVRSDLMDLSGG